MVSEGIETLFLKTHNGGEPTHFGTAMTTLRDPHGRVRGLQAPLGGHPSERA